MIKAPEQVCLTGATLRWTPVDCADGYNIHVDEHYIDTVIGSLSYEIPEAGIWSVSAFIKTDNGDEAHTERTVMILCPTPAEHDQTTPPDIIEGRSLIFDDEFVNGVDPSLWRTELLWGDEVTINQEEQIYIDTQNGNDPPFDTVASPFSTTSDGLAITASPLSQQLQASTDRNFSSGKICAIDRPFKYGYAEVCIRVPCNADGLWPAVWLLNRVYYNNAADKNAAEGNVNGNDKFNFEIDHEWVYGPNYAGPNAVKNALHYFTGDRNDPNNYKLWTLDGSDFKEFNVNTGQVDSQFNTYPDCSGQPQLTLPDHADNFCQEFKTVAWDWQPDYLHYYVDGQIVNCITDPSLIPDQEMYLIINAAVGGTFPYGNPPSQLAPQGQYPASIEVQYARIWQ